MAGKYDNKASLWVRKDGLEADVQGDRTPPLLSGKINVNGQDYQLSAWAGVPRNASAEQVAVVNEFRVAALKLAQVLGSDFKQDKPGGSPVLKLTVSQRYQGKGGGGRSTPQSGGDMSNLY